jgi:hypothetical protein
MDVMPDTAALAATSDANKIREELFQLGRESRQVPPPRRHCLQQLHFSARYLVQHADGWPSVRRPRRSCATLTTSAAQ